MKAAKSMPHEEMPARARQLSRAHGAVEHELCEALMVAGVHDRDHFSPGGPPEQRTPIEAALVRLWDAHLAEIRYWQKRAAKKTRGGR